LICIYKLFSESAFVSTYLYKIKIKKGWDFKTSINDCRLLQSSLDNEVFYLNSLGLSLNVEKCQTMSFTRCRLSISFQYTINDSTLVSVLSVKDLGILCTPTLDFHHQIESSSCRALKVLGFIKRIASEFKLESSIRLLYYT